MRGNDSQAALDFLRAPRHYPGAPRRVQRIETHFAWVFLAGRRVYKLKKPLRQGRMDYRTLARRARGCRAELRLNRRLAPAVYLRVAPLTVDRRGRIGLGGRGRVFDWLVVMRRLPAARMLDRAVAQRRVSAADEARVIAALSAFFMRARPVGASGAGHRRRLRQQALGDARAIVAVDPGFRPLTQRVLAQQRRCLALLAPALSARAAYVIEGHGDLRPEHVNLGPPVNVIDALEFDRRLRLRDPAEELGYLQLELARLGHARLGARLCAGVLARLGEPPPGAVLRLYMSLQALARAKLAAWHVGDPQFPRSARWLARARSYLRAALGNAEAARRAVARSARRGRPAAQQRHQRLAAAHAPQRLAVQRGDRKHGRART